MVSDTNFDSRITRFTLALFIDSGAFQAAPGDGAEFQFGFGRGCEYYFGLFRRVLRAPVEQRDLAGRAPRGRLRGKKKYTDQLRRVG